ncbi:nitrogen permease regulator 2 [Ceratobasidium sp. AG-Ba]|nr:nitrogen permease regulator 2 [Ceratobasidium sp. AG-Ba]
MSSEAYIDESFLPRIQSIFYAVFDQTKGPHIVYQVPEDAITTNHHPYTPSAALSPTINPTSRSPSGSPFTSPPSHPLTLLPEINNNVPSPALIASSQPQPQPQHITSRSSSQSRTAPNIGILDFDSISEYVIPKNELCGRLLHCNTPRHRILGFPVALRDDQYKRVWFRYNLCFVFDREADLSCYEPIVRKCGRVLMACEQESNFLSNKKTSWRMHGIIEQLYEDLNSYSETSIQVDAFNYFELKIFPFYPNPAPVNDWDVPVPLINIEKRMDENWDLTMARVIRHVDGVNHVKRIAELADVDLELGRESVRHLLFYQCIIMTDIFQYSNIYTLKPSIQWLANDPGVKEECPGYVTLPGHAPASWPDLLRLYSRLTNSKTVHEWLESCSSSSIIPRSPGPSSALSLTAPSPTTETIPITSTIDPRRFISFGVIKGFVRRVRRWPVLLPRRGRPRGPGRILSGDQVEGIRSAFQASGTHGDESASVGTVRAGSGGSAGATGGVVGASGFERGPSGGSTSASMLSASIGAAGAMSTSFSPPTTRPSAHALLSSVAAASRNFPNANGSNTASASGTTTALSTSPVAPRALRPTPTQPVQVSRAARPGMGERERSDSTSTIYHPLQGMSTTSGGIRDIPPELEGLLDGTHHGDELCVRFGVSWQVIERWLSLIGGGSGTAEDMGRARIIYR